MGYQEKISNLLTRDVIFILNLIENSGYETRIVGGSVRNLLMNEPISDIDIASVAHPNEIKKIFHENGIRVIDSGINYGTVTIIYNGKSYEITTLREDVENFGRRAIVKFTDSFEIDSKRRDFTMNAIYMDKNGKLYDYHNGIEDIYNRRVRFIGDASVRISEDYLRIFRYFRFVAYYANFKCNEEYLNIIYSVRKKILRLSFERILSELLKILSLKNAYKIIPAMYPILDELFEPEMIPLGIMNELGIDNLTAVEKLCFILRFSKKSREQLSRHYNFPKRIKRLLSIQIEGGNYNQDIRKYLKAAKKEDRMFLINFFAINLYLSAKTTKENIKIFLKKCFDFCNSRYVDFNFRASDLKNYNLSENELKKVMMYTKKMWMLSEYNLSADDCEKIARNFLISLRKECFFQ